MCLYTKQKEPMIAQEDIKCFKLLKKENGQWITPYYDYPVEFNKLLEIDSKNTNIREVFEFYELGEGYFHSESNKTGISSEIDAFKIACSRNNQKCPELKYFKAIIPKGSKYYNGVYEDLCSNKLIILNE